MVWMVHILASVVHGVVTVEVPISDLLLQTFHHARFLFLDLLTELTFVS